MSEPRQTVWALEHDDGGEYHANYDLLSIHATVAGAKAAGPVDRLAAIGAEWQAETDRGNVRWVAEVGYETWLISEYEVQP